MSNIIPDLMVKHRLGPLSYRQILEVVGKNYCDGCFKIKEQCAVLSNYKISYIQKCPCIECIIKPVCNTYCDLRAKLFHKLVVNEIQIRSIPIGEKNA